MGKTQYTEAQIAAVVELRRSGRTAQQIMETLGVPMSTVYTMCRRAGLPRAMSKKGRKRATHYDHDKIEALCKEGLSTRKIAAKIGCSHATVNAVLHSRGLSKLKNHSSRAGDFEPARVARVVRGYADGRTLVELAKAEGIGRSKIRKILASAGVEIRTPGGGDRRFTGRATMRWRLIWNEDDDEQWRHFETGKTCTLTDRGIEAAEERFIVLEPELGARFATRDLALEAVEAEVSK
jgi:hypothetical protein